MTNAALNFSASYRHPLPVPRYPGGDREELRFAPRKATSLPGLLRSASQFEPIACRIINISTTGVRVTVASEHAGANWHSEWLLGDLTLEVPFDRMAVRCRAVWKIDNQIGLRFRAPPSRLD